MEGGSIVTPETGAVKIARILTGDPSFNWDWQKGEPKMVEEPKMEVIESNTSKVCKACGQDKPLDEYHRDKSYVDGRKSKCKVCAASGACIAVKSNKIDPGKWRCADCGLEVSLDEAPEHFGKSTDTTSGLAYRCLSCKRKKQRVYRAERAGVTVPEAEASLMADNTPAGGKMVLDLTHRPEILTWLRKQAQEEERSIVGQIIWELKQIMDVQL